MNQYQRNLLARADWPLRTPPARNVAALLEEQAHAARQIARCHDNLTLLRQHIQRVYDLDDQIKQLLFGPASEETRSAPHAPAAHQDELQ